MNIKKVIKYTLIAVPLLFIAKFGIEKIIYDSNKIPEINPHRTQKVRMHGQFPLDPNKYYIKASVRYIATNPKCDNIIWLAGTRFAQDESVDLNATMSDNHYELNIYNDYYKKGVCDWKIGEIDILTITKDTNTRTYYVAFSTRKNGGLAYNYDSHPIKAKIPLNFVCNYEHHAASDYTLYICKDFVQNISNHVPQNNISNFDRPIFLSNSQKELEINFQQMAEPTQKLKQGEK